MAIKNNLNMNELLYNGLTFKQIEANFHPDMIPLHRERYLDNCKQVIKNESAGYNLDWCQSLRNENFTLTNFYFTGQHLTS